MTVGRGARAGSGDNASTTAVNTSVVADDDYDNQVETDEPWHAPLEKPQNHCELPENHRLRGGKHLPPMVGARSAAGIHRVATASGLTYHFALSTGHSGTTTLSNADTYERAGFDTQRCFFGFETLAQGWREFARHHPSRRSASRFVARFYIPRITNLTLAAGKTCFVDFGHQSFFSHILDALRKHLGPRMKLLRLRRSLWFALGRRR